MVKSLRSAWFGLFQRVGRTSTSRVDGAVERHPAESLVVLPDGELMYVRHASLAAAKDLLATQRAIERRMRESQAARRVAEVAR